jgi:hypothetical protein
MALVGSQAVKVLSPEMLYLLERAEALCIAEGHAVRRVMASVVRAPGVGGRFARCIAS